METVDTAQGYLEKCRVPMPKTLEFLFERYNAKKQSGAVDDWELIFTARFIQPVIQTIVETLEKKKNE